MILSDLSFFSELLSLNFKNVLVVVVIPIEVVGLVDPDLLFDDEGVADPELVGVIDFETGVGGLSFCSTIIMFQPEIKRREGFLRIFYKSFTSSRHDFVVFSLSHSVVMMRRMDADRHHRDNHNHDYFNKT